MTALKEFARAKLEEYETIITEDLTKIETKIANLMAQPTADALTEAEQMTQTATATVKKALASAEPAAQQAIENRLAKEAQGDDLLTESRVKTAIKVAPRHLRRANVAKLVATAGADVTSYLSIAKTLVSFGWK